MNNFDFTDDKTYFEKYLIVPEIKYAIKQALSLCKTFYLGLVLL